MFKEENGLFSYYTDELLAFPTARLILYSMKKYDFKKYDCKIAFKDVFGYVIMRTLEQPDIFYPDYKDSALTKKSVKLIDRFILEFLKNEKRSYTDISLDLELNYESEIRLKDVIPDEYDFTIKVYDDMYIEMIKNSLEKDDWDFLELRFGLENRERSLSQLEMAKFYNKSRNYISRREKLLLNKLKELLYFTDD